MSESNVCRIPEVIQRIRQAQEILESTKLESGSAEFYWLRGQSLFEPNSKQKFAACIVQLGLYDRYRKFNSEPKFFVGNINGDSAVKVACGVLSFEEMLKKQPSLGGNRDGRRRWRLFPSRPSRQFWKSEESQF